jgi:transposase
VSEVIIIGLDIAKHVFHVHGADERGRAIFSKRISRGKLLDFINAIRGHLAEYGWIAPKGPSHVAMLADLLEEEEMASSLPEAARAMFRLMLDLFAGLDGKIADLDKEIARRAREDEVSRRLMTVPGIGPISATAIAARHRRPRPLPRAATSPLGSVSRLFKDRPVLICGRPTKCKRFLTEIGT